MTETWILIGLWLLFAATHMGMASVSMRPRLVGALGDRGYQGLYSLVAFAVFVPLVWYYFAHKHAGPALWAVGVGPALLLAIYIGMGVAFTLVVCSLVQPNPFSVGQDGRAEPRGIHLITRHSTFLGLGLFGALHLIPNGYASDVAFFGGMVAFSVGGCLHQDARKLVLEGERFRPFHERTPFIPFTGRETARGLRELPWYGVAAGIVATIALRWYHHSLF
jgi:uncharacterized membrane protein